LSDIPTKTHLKGKFSMHVILQSVLTTSDISYIHSLIAMEKFVDGRATSTLSSKNNLQLPAESEAARLAGRLVLDRLSAHPIFAKAVYPRCILPPLFSKYEIGMTYPEHVDNTMMDGCRTDVSVTLFLSDLASYTGGELVVDTGNGERQYRLPAGNAIAYPSTRLHYVAPVTSGVRVAAVTWVQSMIRDASKREVLFGLYSATPSLSGTCYAGRLRCSYQNLLRMWAEV
jgi:PKHD-type hydroxylase